MQSAPLPGQQPGQRVRNIPLTVETLPGGGMRVSSPLARGWARTARNSHELAVAVQQAFLEVSCASYAQAKGRVYDLDALTTQVPGDTLAGTPQRRVRGPVRKTRRKSHDVASWARMEDGRWRSPAGRLYPETTRAVQNVIAKREARGLPT